MMHVRCTEKLKYYQIVIYDMYIPDNTPVSEILKELSRFMVGSHPVRRYIKAFEGLDYKGNNLLVPGGDSVNICLQDGNVLKISSKRKYDGWTDRPFDAPVIEKGTISVKHGGDGCFETDVNYLIQPMVDTNVSEKDLRQFEEEIRTLGYGFVDKHQKETQIGHYKGKIVLIDPFAVDTLDKCTTVEQVE